MAQAATKPVMTTADYLAWEVEQTERHEFVGGETFAMAGAEDRHVTVTGNVYMALRQHLSGTPCRTFMSDMRLSVTALGSYFYPDIMVTCAAADLASPLAKSEPKLTIYKREKNWNLTPILSYSFPVLKAQPNGSTVSAPRYSASANSITTI